MPHIAANATAYCVSLARSIAAPGSLAAPSAPWHLLYFFPLPHGQGLFAPTFPKLSAGFSATGAIGQRTAATSSTAAIGRRKTAENFAQSTAPNARPHQTIRFQ